MKRVFLFMFISLIAIFTLVGCSDDKATNPNQDYNNLKIPEGFNWTNLDYVQLNIALDNDEITTKNAVIVRYGENVLVRKFLQNGRLEVNINSIKGYNNLVVEVPAYGFSQEISTNVKTHNLVVPTTGKSRGSDDSSIDPYFKKKPKTDYDSERIKNMPDGLAEQYMTDYNIYIPTRFPEDDDDGWCAYKFGSGNGKIEHKKDGKNRYLLMGTDWVVMQTIKIEDDDDEHNFYNEFLEGRKTNQTANLSECPYGSYLTTTYIFLDDDERFLDLHSNSPSFGADPDRFFYNTTNNPAIRNTEYVVIIAQYNGPTGNVRLDSWQLNFYDTFITPTDSDGDGVPDEDDEFPDDPNLAGMISVPGGIVMFEDLWPDQGDYDFNDLYVYFKDTAFMLNGDNKIVYIDLDIKILTAGANIPNGLGVRFIDAVNIGGEINYETIDDGTMLSIITASDLPTDGSTGEPDGDWSGMTCKDEFAPNSVVLFKNVSEITPGEGSSIRARIYFDRNEEQPVNPILDFFLFRTNSRQHEIHLAGYPPTSAAEMANFNTGDDASLTPPGNWYKTEDNYPWALYFATEKPIPAPLEHVPIFRAYPDFASWVTSGGERNQDWYLNYDSELTETSWE